MKYKGDQQLMKKEPYHILSEIFYIYFSRNCQESLHRCIENTGEIRKKTNFRLQPKNAAKSRKFSSMVEKLSHEGQKLHLLEPSGLPKAKVFNRNQNFLLFGFLLWPPKFCIKNQDKSLLK